MSAPFLKWAGGKRYLAEEILKRLPPKIDKYYEPMVGAGAVFFELAKQGRFNKAKISDVNEELMITYRAIRDNVSEVLLYLNQLEQEHQSKKSEEYFYKVRELNTWDLDSPQVAARMIYLNKTCFNGLYRVNKSGRFNAPYGHYKNPTICNPKELIKVSRTLQNVQITIQDFEAAVTNIKSSDAAYFDPPYWPVKAGSFTEYTGGGFDSLDQERLANLAQKLKKKGVYALFSNSDVPSIMELYAGLHIEKVLVPRRINSDGKGRGKITEVLIETKQIRRRKDDNPNS
jgi:DNA adenine methylase